MDNVTKRKKKADNSFDPDKILIQKRNIFLYEGVTQESSLRIVKELMALDSKKTAPIYFWINCFGGLCANGMAIVQTMRSIKSKVITIINTEVCSMGGIISIAGNERWISRNGVFMAHDAYGGGPDYSTKVKDYADYFDKYYKNVLRENLKVYTKLTDSQLKKARDGELWLFADDCLKYGIADKII